MGQGVGDEVKQGVGEEVRSEDLQYYYVYVYIYVTLYQINYITLELALHTEKDMHLRHSHVAFLDRKRGKRPRISDNADDDHSGPVVAVKHAKRVPFNNEDEYSVHTKSH